MGKRHEGEEKVDGGGKHEEDEGEIKIGRAMGGRSLRDDQK